MPNDNDLCFSTTCKNNNFISITFSFIFSHPLYFSYFIFFSPYLFKFIFFISSSPLFLIITLLVLLSVIATSLPHHSKLGFMQTVFDKIESKLSENDGGGGGEGGDEFVEFEDFEIYKIVFRDPLLMVMEEEEEVKAVVEVSATELEKEMRLERLFEELDRFEESTAAEIETKEKVMLTSSISMAETEMKEVMLTSAISRDELEKVTSSVKPTAEAEMKPDLETVLRELRKSETVIVTSSFSGEDLLTGHSSVTEQSNSSPFDSSSSFGSYESIEEDSTKTVVEKLPLVTSSNSGENRLLSRRRLYDSPIKSFGESQKMKPLTSSNSVIDYKTVTNNLVQVDSSSSFGSYGSMRKEKEWKRTLACKLFEERRSLEGGEEGMDSLWESYETDNSSRKLQSKLKNKKKSEFKYFDDGENEDDDDEEDEFMSNGQLCCLKALKLSTGKMNLGMGKPNLVKISKALKGFGWLHHVGSKHGKKK